MALFSSPDSARDGSVRPIARAGARTLRTGIAGFVSRILVPLSGLVAACYGSADGPTQPIVDTPVSTRLTVSVSTTGYAPGGDFTLTVDGRLVAILGVNAYASLSDVRPGSHDVVLGVRDDCRAADATRQVFLSDTISIHFDVHCLGWGTVRVVAKSLGASPWAGHWLELQAGDVGVPLLTNDTTVVRVLASTYTPAFRPALNCTAAVAPGEAIVVRPETTTELDFHATCEPVGMLRVSVVLRGEDLPASVPWDVLEVGGGVAESLRLWDGWQIEHVLAPGDWTGQLGVLPANCAITSGDPVEFSIAEDAVTEVTVSIACVRSRGTLRVTLETANPSGVFGLSVNGSCTTVDDIFSDLCTWLEPNGTVLVDMIPGTYGVHVTSFVPGDTACTVSPEDPVIAVVQTGVITDVAFKASCT